MKISFSGTQSTGKTFDVYKLCVKMKENYPNKTVYALTSTSMFSPFPMNRGVNIESQFWRFSNQMKSELDACAKNDIVISDRSIIDPIAYTKYLGFEDLYNAQISMAQEFIYTYDKIYYKSLKNNDYKNQDGRRDNDEEYRSTIDEIIHDILFKLFNTQELLSRIETI